MSVKAKTIVFSITERMVIGGPEADENIDQVIGRLLSDGWHISACGGAGAGGGEFKPSNIRGWEKYFGFIVFSRKVEEPQPTH